MQSSGLYEKRLVAFLDILGFTKFVNSSIDDSVRQKQLQEYYQLTKDFLAGTLKAATADIRVTVISDSIVITILFDEKNDPTKSLSTLPEIVVRVNNFIVLIHHRLKLAVRGAITVGDVFHSIENGDVIFGPAYNEAVLKEKEAHVPRVLITNNVFHSLGFIANEPMDELTGIKKDIDGQYFLDHLGTVTLYSDPLLIESHIKTVREVAVEMIKESRQDARLAPKALWYSNYFNEFIAEQPADLTALKIKYSEID